MKVGKKVKRALGAMLFTLGFVIGLVVFVGAVWADFEAAMFDTAIKGDKSLHPVSCPVVIVGDETGTISAAFHNPLDRPVNYFIRTRISRGFVTYMREDKELLPVAPGETERLEWEVTADDAAYGRVVLVKILLTGNYPLPSRQATCGVLTLDVPYVNGKQLLALAVVSSLVCMALGGGLWFQASRPVDEGFPKELARAMVALAGAVLVGMVVAFLGPWLLGLVVVVVTALLLVEVLRHVVQGP
ncbi:MAG: hypothetical protein P8129_25025 [Anaerolineae bacterium]